MNRLVQGRERFSGRSESIRVTASHDQLGLEIAGLSDAGLARRENQDALGYRVPDPATRRERGALFVVCDGIGTLSAGQDASDLAVRTFIEAYDAAPLEDPGQMLRRAADYANAELLRARGHYEGGARLGTTLVSALIRGHQYYVLNVGDSRAYICRDGDLRQVSRDHSPAFGHRAEDRRVTHALGTGPQVMADVFGPNQLVSGDDLLLCSDGLTTSVPEPTIRSIIGNSKPAEAAALLVERAKTAGARDNVTVLLVRICGPAPSGLAKTRGNWREWGASLRSLLSARSWESANPIRALSDGGWRTRRGLLIGMTWFVGALALGMLFGLLLRR